MSDSSALPYGRNDERPELSARHPVVPRHVFCPQTSRFWVVLNETGWTDSNLEPTGSCYSEFPAPGGLGAELWNMWRFVFLSESQYEHTDLWPQQSFILKGLSSSWSVSNRKLVFDSCFCPVRYYRLHVKAKPIMSFFFLILCVFVFIGSVSKISHEPQGGYVSKDQLTWKKKPKRSLNSTNFTNFDLQFNVWLYYLLESLQFKMVAKANKHKTQK